MTTTRRLLVLLALTVTTVLGASATAANATFSDSVALSSTTVGTGIVAPATNVRVDVSCITTTTVIKRSYTVYTWGTSQTSYAQTTTTATTSSNVEFNDTVRTEGPASNQYSTTQTIKDTELYATLRWTPSTATRVTGYRMTAHTSVGEFAMGTTGPTATSMTGQYDASVTAWNPRLSIDTLTDYGWVGTSALSNVVKC